MALEYKLEFNNPDGKNDDGALIHVKNVFNAFQDTIGKEDYLALDPADKQALITGLFNIEGVTEVQTTAFRIWIMKSPIYSWAEVMQPVLFYLRDQFGETELSPLAGSAEIDGSGLRLGTETGRRTIK